MQTVGIDAQHIRRLSRVPGPGQHRQVGAEARPDLVRDGRKQLVGLRTNRPSDVLEEGAQIVADPNQPKPMTMLGHVTSAYWSENCGRSIAMALVAGGRERIGQTLYIPMKDRTIAVEVTDMVFLDKEGARLNG